MEKAFSRFGEKRELSIPAKQCNRKAGVFRNNKKRENQRAACPRVLSSFYGGNKKRMTSC